MSRIEGPQVTAHLGAVNSKRAGCHFDWPRATATAWKQPVLAAYLRVTAIHGLPITALRHVLPLELFCDTRDSVENPHDRGLGGAQVNSEVIEEWPWGLRRLGNQILRRHIDGREDHV